jgi:hypothetical protein
MCPALDAVAASRGKTVEAYGAHSQQRPLQEHHFAWFSETRSCLLNPFCQAVQNLSATRARERAVSAGPIAREAFQEVYTNEHWPTVHSQQAGFTIFSQFHLQAHMWRRAGARTRCTHLYWVPSTCKFRSTPDQEVKRECRKPVTIERALSIINALYTPNMYY